MPLYAYKDMITGEIFEEIVDIDKRDLVRHNGHTTTRLLTVPMTKGPTTSMGPTALAIGESREKFKQDMADGKIPYSANEIVTEEDLKS